MAGRRQDSLLGVGAAAGSGLRQAGRCRTGDHAQGATGADGTREKGGTSSQRAFNSASQQGNQLEQGFKPGTIRSGLWLFEDAGCSLANTSLRSASVDLPYLGNQSGKGKNSEASFIIEAGKASAATRISATDVAKHCQAQNIPAWGTECTR